MIRLALILPLFASPVFAQAISVPGSDLSGYARTSDIPSPRLTVPPAEAVGGVAGTAGTYLPGNAQLPRITRAMTVTTASGGAFSGTWSAAFSVAPNVVLTPIYAGSGNVTCFLTATPTTTGFAGKCTNDQSAILGLSIVTAGLTIGPQNSAAGMSVQVLGIPPTQ